MFGLRMGTGVSAGLRAKLDTAANVATICAVAALVSAVLVKTYLTIGPSAQRLQAQAASQAQVGAGTALRPDFRQFTGEAMAGLSSWPSLPSATFVKTARHFIESYKRRWARA